MEVNISLVLFSDGQPTGTECALIASPTGPLSWVLGPLGLNESLRYYGEPERKGARGFC
jgi:hypothetical protein